MITKKEICKFADAFDIEHILEKFYGHVHPNQ